MKICTLKNLLTRLSDLPQVDSSDNEYLKKKITKEEILTALKDMKPHKSPGSDGLSCSFYLKFFHILGDALCNVIKDIQTSMTLFFALFSKLIVYKCIKYILHHMQK